MINSETFPDMQPDTPHARQQWRIDILRLADEAVMKGYPMVAIEILKEGFRTLSIQYVVAESEVQTLQRLLSERDQEENKRIDAALARREAIIQSVPGNPNLPHFENPPPPPPRKGDDPNAVQINDLQRLTIEDMQEQGFSMFNIYPQQRRIATEGLSMAGLILLHDPNHTGKDNSRAIIKYTIHQHISAPAIERCDNGSVAFFDTVLAAKTYAGDVVKLKKVVVRPNLIDGRIEVVEAESLEIGDIFIRLLMGHLLTYRVLEFDHYTLKAERVSDGKFAKNLSWHGYKDEQVIRINPLPKTETPTTGNEQS